LGRILVVDPSLQDERSHHAYAARALLSEAQSLGLDCEVFAHQRATGGVRRIPARRWFSRGGYEHDPADHSPARERRWVALVNAAILEDLERLRKKVPIETDDLIFFPAITSRLVLATCQWIAGFDPDQAPRFGMCLMFQMGWDPTGKLGAVGEMYYRRSFGLVPQSLRDRIVYTCETEGLAAEYEPLLGVTPVVRPVPTLQSLIGPVRRTVGNPPRISFLGYSKPEKGAHLVPEIVRGFHERFGEARFTVQLYGHHAEFVRDISARLRKIRPRPEIVSGPVPPERMVQILEATDLLLLPYDAKTYRDRGSALFTEAKTVGVPVVLPEGTAIGTEAVKKGIGVAIADHTSDATLDAIGVALSHLPELRAAVAAEAERVREADPGYLAPLLKSFGQARDRTADTDAVDEKPAETDGKPVVHLLHHLARSGGTFISRCLATMSGVSLLSEINPGGVEVSNRFDPLFQAQFWLRLLSANEVARLRQVNASFAEVLQTIARRASERGDALVVRDWSYLDFTERPLDFIDGHDLPAGSFRLELAAALADVCSVRQAATVRHPAAMWMSWRNYRPQSTLSLAEFLHGCRRFAESACALGFVRYEDFTRDPDGALRKLCGLLGVEFDPGFRDRWFLYRNLTGDVRSFDHEEIRPTVERAVEADLMASLRDNPDYRSTVDLLGYSFDRIP